MRRLTRGDGIEMPTDFVVSIGTGSKLYPARIDRILVALKPNGKVSEILRRFGWGSDESDEEWKLRINDDIDWSAVSEKMVKELKRDTLNQALHEEIAEIMLSVTQLHQKAKDPWKVLKTNNYSAFVPGGWVGEEKVNPERVGKHIKNLGRSVLFGTIDELLGKESVYSIYTSTFDRLEPGMLNEISNGRVISVSSLATLPLLDVKPKLRCNRTGGIDTQAEAGAFEIERIALRGAVSTAQYSTTQRNKEMANDEDEDEDENDEGTLPEKEKETESESERADRAAVFNTTALQLLKHVFPKTLLMETPPPPERKNVRDVILLVRRSNTEEALGTQLERTVELLNDREAKLDYQYDNLYIVTLDSIKGTDATPVGGGKNGRTIYVLKITQRGINPLNPFDVQYEPGPQGIKVNDNVTFVKELLAYCIEKRPCDVLVASLSRVCLQGALDVFGTLVDEGVWLFSWDLWVAVQPQGYHELLVRTMDEHYRLRVEDANALEQIKELSAGGRMWRYDNAFIMPIWNRERDAAEGAG